jgi:hypothetical protein
MLLCVPSVAAYEIREVDADVDDTAVERASEAGDAPSTSEAVDIEVLALGEGTLVKRYIEEYGPGPVYKADCIGGSGVGACVGSAMSLNRLV